MLCLKNDFAYLLFGSVGVGRGICRYLTSHHPAGYLAHVGVFCLGFLNNLTVAKDDKLVAEVDDFLKTV